MKTKKHPALRGAFGYAVFGVVFVCAAILVGVYAGQDYKNAVSDTLYIPAAAESTETEAETDASETVPKESSPSALLMIDPGHGGEDGGASSESGLAEKDLNLALSDDIAHLCVLFGIPYKMTREEDTLLYDYYSELEDYTGKKKSLDLKNRLKLTEETGASVFLGIHMNKFTDSRYSGLQVYYSPNDTDSGQLAEAVQSYVKAHLQNDNERAAKKATSSIYLLNNLEIPSILVECGFLSNPAEAASLGTPSYRAALAATIFAPVSEYFVRSNT